MSYCYFCCLLAFGRGNPLLKNIFPKAIQRGGRILRQQDRIRQNRDTQLPVTVDHWNQPVYFTLFRERLRMMKIHAV